MTISIRTIRQAAFAWMVMGTGAAQAYDIPPPPPPMYDMLILPLFPNSNAVPFSGQSGGSSTTRGKTTSVKSTLASGSSRVAANARQLAAVFPPAQREQMTQVYRQSFDTWRQLERKLGLPTNDVAGAVAAFVAGNYMAYRNVEVPDKDYLQLVDQMRTALTTSRAFAGASATDKRNLYEQMAMVGTFMAVARLSFQQQPNATAEKNFRDSAAANLEAALKMPADQVRITERGLTLP